MLNGILSESLVIRKGRVSDVQDIIRLVNNFVMQNLMLPRGPQDLYENIRDVVVLTRLGPKNAVEDHSKEEIIGCGALHVMWGDLAEIRSLAVAENYQGQGLGACIVDCMKKEALALGIKRLFAFTLAEKFFKAQGFEVVPRKDLPPVVWQECRKCPKYFKCDEIGMILNL
ncbi:MAG: N-acetyltransferase [Desulfobacterales bacterium]|nr:N-acetyltransferase [Desulfobacterales bacterium]MDD4073178.1 N-acetyltransferase [Desulfobacterales bacterium]MDD4393633.1 N-acetyltransferase [Desulfobacterales bacterium]